MKRTIFLLILIPFFMEDVVYSLDKFKPWGAKIRVGDENKLIQLNGHSVIKSPGNYIHTGHSKTDFTGAYNGVQGGAYFLIRFFQIAISPQDGPSCRFTPTCSAYGRHSVVKHGALLGAVMAGERLIRCNPFYPHGQDRVPDKLFE